MIGPFRPIAVYDVRDPWWIDEDLGAHVRLLDWVRSYGVDPTYARRFEIYLIDCPSLRVYDLALDGHGKPYRDGSEMASREPYDVLLRDLPPRCPTRPCEYGAVSVSHVDQASGHPDSSASPPRARTAPPAPNREPAPQRRNEDT